MISNLRRIKNKIESLLPYESFEKPIFIIAPPRSGSTFLFECLTKFNGLYHLNFEADPIWWSIFPYERMKSPSDYVDKHEITYNKIKLLRRRIYQSAAINCKKKYPEYSNLEYFFGIKNIRYLDKTIANCFHLEVIDLMFPDAQYIFLVRDPRANISSMIDGWPLIERFGKSQLTSLIQKSVNAEVSHWTYPAPPGWQDLLTKSLPEICAWSWKQHIEYPLYFFDKCSKKPIYVRYEELFNDAESIIRKLSYELNLRLEHDVIDYVRNSPLSRTTVSQPSPNKWQTKNHENIISILPMIEITAKKIDYDLSDTLSV